MILPVGHTKQLLTLDAFKVRKVAAYSLPCRPKLLTCLGKVQVAAHRNKSAQHGDGDATGTLGLIQVALRNLAARHVQKNSLKTVSGIAHGRGQKKAKI